MIRREECREEEANWGREKVRIFSVSLHPELISKLFSSQWQKGEPYQTSGRIQEVSTGLLLTL